MLSGPLSRNAKLSCGTLRDRERRPEPDWSGPTGTVGTLCSKSVLVTNLVA